MCLVHVSGRAHACVVCSCVRVCDASCVCACVHACGGRAHCCACVVFLRARMRVCMLDVCCVCVPFNLHCRRTHTDQFTLLEQWHKRQKRHTGPSELPTLALASAAGQERRVPSRHRRPTRFLQRACPQTTRGGLENAKANLHARVLRCIA